MDYLQFSECVNLVESYLKIDEVIARHANLKKIGEYYRCRCLFHDDNGESLIVNPETGTFYCPVCHAGGNALKFLAMAEKISLFEEIERQAKIFRLELYPKKVGFDEARFEAKKREIAEIYEYAKDFYYEILTDSQEGAVCRKYLESRGISNFAIEKFNLGFVAKADKKLTRFLYEYNFNVGMILESGLVVRIEKLFDDKFQNCIVFPFSDPINDTTILIGRVFDFDKKVFYESEGVTSKYIYPDENSAFNSQKLIFGLNAAKKSCEQKDTVIVVEDCLDAVILSSAGIENVVAVPEKNLDSEIAKYLTKYVKHIIFCLKNGEKLELDEEILKAVATGTGNIFVAALSESPAKYLEEHGKDAFIKCIEKPVRFDEYEFFKRILSPKADRSETTSLVIHTTKKLTVGTTRDKSIGVAFLKLACKDMFFLNYVAQIIPPEIFDYEPHQEIFRYLKICLDEDSMPDKEDAIDYFDKESYKEFLRITLDPEIIDELKQDDKDSSTYLKSDEKIVRSAAEDATEQLLRKIFDTNYFNERTNNIGSYTDFKDIIFNLNNIKQTAVR
ncbi:MAG: toprim domain-containing protein [Selenomonadaceae bacterium]|nr:toprim domain-containing protein [Selenomonadaceae bacterium]